MGEKAEIQVKFSQKQRAVVKRCPSALGIVPGDVFKEENVGSGSIHKGEGGAPDCHGRRSHRGTAVRDRGDQGGMVAPEDTNTSLGSPALFTFTAPSTTWKAQLEVPGFSIRNNASRAGRVRSTAWNLTHGLRLRIQHRIADDPASSGGRVGNALFDGAVQFDASLEPMGVWEGDSRFAADISVVRPIKVGHVDGPHQSCSGTASQTEDWQLRMSVDAKTQSIRLLFGYVTSDESGTGGGRNCGEAKELHVALFGELKQVVMPASSGARKEVSHASISKTREWLTVTVLESPD